MSTSKNLRKNRISKIAQTTEVAGLFENFQSNVTNYNTRTEKLMNRGGEKSSVETLYGIYPQGEEKKITYQEPAPHLSTRYAPDMPGVSALHLSDGVYQNPITKQIFNYNEGFKTPDGRVFPPGGANLQSSLVQLAHNLDAKGLVKEADEIDSILNEILRKKS
jgi:hypothetical protein